MSIVVQSLTPDAVKTLIHAFITSKLDYCNSLSLGVTDQQLKRLQSAQNAAARLVTGARRSDHITPVLQSLRWLSVRQRIRYKIAMLVHKCLNGRAPQYLIDECRLAGGRRSGTRSAGRQYSADELRALWRRRHTLSRPVRKTVFSLYLWQPSSQRLRQRHSGFPHTSQ